MSQIPSLKVDTSVKGIILLTLPISMAKLIPELNYLFNASFLGHLGNKELALAGITGVYYLIFSAIGYGLNNALLSIMSRRAGEDNRNQIFSTLWHGLLVATGLACTFIILTKSLVYPLMIWAGIESDGAAMAGDFLNIRIFGLLFLYSLQMQNAFLISIQQTRYLVLIAIIQSGVNLALDYGLIFGHFGLPAMGFNGAAYASIISELIGMLTVLAIISGLKITSRFGIRPVYDVSVKTLKLVFSQGFPLMSQLAISTGAAKYTHEVLSKIKGVESQFQACEADYWNRGGKEVVTILGKNGKKTPIKALSLGNSVSTPKNGITAEVIEVSSLDEVEKLGIEKVKGKIVFFNRPMDPTQIRTFSAYGGAVDQRVYGPSKAAEFGAVAALVRSMTTSSDDFPHTGVTVYKDSVQKVPGIAISTNDADKLSQLIKSGPVKVFLKTSCKSLGKKSAPTVIGEIKGTEFPDEIIVVGGHLDSWDVGQGAHDDGSGCIQSIEVLRLFSALGYKPKRTIRCVLFSNEENGLAGGQTYARVSNEKKEFHLAALESDAGGFTPRGFSFDADTSVFKTYYKHVSRWLPLLESYGLFFEKGGSGADIGPLKSQKGLLIGLRPDSQRYFDFHHTANDRIENVNKRELELGAAAMASLIYLIDKYGIK